MGLLIEKEEREGGFRQICHLLLPLDMQNRGGAGGGGLGPAALGTLGRPRRRGKGEEE